MGMEAKPVLSKLAREDKDKQVRHMAADWLEDLQA